jgi:CRP/FNR family transcriptional regulator
MDIVKLLQFTEFFKDLSEKNLTSLAKICIPKTVEKKETLFTEGQEGHSIYLLVSGGVQIFKTSKDGRETVIKTIVPGEIFAEVILFEEKNYPVGARAVRKSELLLIPRFQLLCLLVEENFRNDFIRMLMSKQRYLTQRILYLSAYDLEERFFRFIKEQYGVRDEYTIHFSKKDFAASIGTIPETLSRLIARLEKEGKITWKEKSIAVRKGFWEEIKLDE